MGRVRSLLKRIEPEMRDQIGIAMKAAGNQILAEMRATAPVLQQPAPGRVAGALRDALSMKFYPNTLRLRVGLVGAGINRKLFYGRILEFGRGLKRVTDDKGRKIGVIQPGRFVYARRTVLRDRLEAQIKGIWRRALDKAASGASDG